MKCNYDFEIILNSIDKSHPFESLKDGIGVADHFTVIEYESVIFSIVGRYIDCFVFSELSGSLMQKFVLN